MLSSGPATFLQVGSDHHKTVLLLHGGGLDCASLSWRLLAPELAKHYHVIAPNWPGYAGSAALGRPYTIADIGHWLMRFLDHQKIDNAAMVGISMGGGAALWSAINHPMRVNALIPVGTYGVAPRAPYHLLSFLLTRLPLNAISYAAMRRYPSLLRRAVAGLFADPNKVTPELVAEVSDVLASADNGTPFTHFQRGEMTARRLRSFYREDLHRIAQPTLFIHGAQDALVPLETVQMAAKQMPHAKLEVLDVGHWPMREQPEQFNRLVSTFLDSLNN
ncbi:alpha/beta hydrolase [Cognatiyoonia sp. IB215446]|uniref:alpha/beta fold hydrolase n=1 Tax=Cognatiyoonia sp. IB215446 TaxID=3097355 RepID=UPI002A0F6674|nr:alpha/beta hydrolase [Cognatiyoonia sp. IB215446]MDX8350417.1 alpha/beta hydrolase [Cognatiyoonia sp. IB215446]